MAGCPECGQEILAPVDFTFWLFMHVRQRTPLDAILYSQYTGTRSLFAAWDRFSCSHCKAAALAMQRSSIAGYYAMGLLFFLFGLTMEGWMIAAMRAFVFGRVPQAVSLALLAALSVIVIFLCVRLWYYVGVAVWWKSFARLRKTDPQDYALHDSRIRFDSFVFMITLVISGLCVWFAVRLLGTPLL